MKWGGLVVEQVWSVWEQVYVGKQEFSLGHPQCESPQALTQWVRRVGVWTKGQNGTSPPVTPPLALQLYTYQLFNCLTCGCHLCFVRLMLLVMSPPAWNTF